MLITNKTSEKQTVSIHDCSGSEIPGVISFDTNTKEIEMLIWLLKEPGSEPRPLLKTLSSDGTPSPFVARFKLIGAYALVDGQKY